MDIERIFESYDNYINIYQHELNKLDSNASNLLLNSLYLSVYTTFEYFLENLIQSYVRSITESDKGIKLEGLKGSIAMKYFINTNKNSKKLEQLLKDPKTKTYDSIKSILYNKIDQEELSKYLRFEFLHDNKLKEHYPDIFAQIFNDSELLEHIELSTFETISNVNQVQKYSAANFISKYRDIRNSIAHENFHFSIENEQFVEYVSNFKYIISEMIKKYESVNNFPITNSSNDLLKEFS
ncbi:HEPN domain-containing protein [Streptococcus panodentis]|uniref:RiboL-PSP-HEPN domain-containing protein n=1 Tax=Streptococcus panodentis TaxID=1581472 RepID=A0ABS5AY76_9STRE|nr:HEPN domain-containing protein [Streptococcus panodentis]MBP2621539.1 hypothetical protein [Streptococcus panodentis]